MGKVPNLLSITRMILTFIMIFTRPLSTMFLVIYVLCGISDALDGYIARKTNSTSRIGEKLDSIADFLLVAVLIILLYPIVKPSKLVFAWIIGIAAIRLVSVVVVYFKHKTFGMLHTYGNKITGLLLFVLPIILVFIRSEIVFYIICAAASISGIEELMITMVSKEFDANRKSVFIK